MKINKVYVTDLDKDRNQYIHFDPYYELTRNFYKVPKVIYIPLEPKRMRKNKNA